MRAVVAAAGAAEEKPSQRSHYPHRNRQPGPPELTAQMTALARIPATFFVSDGARCVEVGAVGRLQKVQYVFRLNLLSIWRHLPIEVRCAQGRSTSFRDWWWPRGYRTLVTWKTLPRATANALAELYCRYHPRLFKFVYRLTKSHPATEEVVNDIMLAVWKSAGSYRGDAKPSTWIFGIAYRQSLKRLTRRRLTIAGDVPSDQLPDDRATTIEQEEWIRSGLAELPAAQRVAVELVFFLGLSYEEVAEVTDCPVNTVKTRMFHARRKLRESLSRMAGPGERH